MRRRLQKFLPIVLIALAVQILAPVAAAFAAATAASDPLQSGAICHDAGRSVPSDQGPGDPNGNPAHDGACSICCITHAAAPLDAPKSAPVSVLRRDAQRIAWVDGATHRPLSRPGSNHQARAPPQLT